MDAGRQAGSQAGSDILCDNLRKEEDEELEKVLANTWPHSLTLMACH